jgi:DNA-binding FadR family transcriptional regulator
MRESIDSITAQILQLIQKRKLPPGSRLPSERELVQALHVSRPALRESLARLETTRLIVCRPNSGIYLAEQDSPPSFESVVLHSDLGLPLDRETVINSMEVRQILEVHAVDLACLRHSQADAAHLGKIVEETRACLRHNRSIIDLDEAFHLGVVAASHNPVYVQIVYSFYRLSRLRREIYFSDIARCRRSYREHVIILRALLGRDSEAARHAMQRHIDEGLRRSALVRSSPIT